MYKKIILWSFGVFASLSLLFLLYVIFIVKISPVNTNKDNSIEVSGIIDDLYVGGVKDLVFKLKKDKNIYYINRALENGFDLDEIKNELLGKEIILWYAHNRFRNGGHMTQLKYQDSIYYTEWQKPLASKN